MSESDTLVDGTTNFAHGYPSFAVSVGVLFRGKPATAAVVVKAWFKLFMTCFCVIIYWVICCKVHDQVPLFTNATKYKINSAKLAI